MFHVRLYLYLYRYRCRYRYVREGRVEREEGRIEKRRKMRKSDG